MVHGQRPAKGDLFSMYVLELSYNYYIKETQY